MILSGGLAIAYLLAEVTVGEKFHELEAFLFGDISAVTRGEVVGFGLLSLFVISVLLLVWNRLLVVLLDPDFAHSRLWHIQRIEFVFLGHPRPA